jgi:hypothetical protein
MLLYVGDAKYFSWGHSIPNSPALLYLENQILQLGFPFALVSCNEFRMTALLGMAS